MDLLNLLGMVAGALTTFAYLPQVIRTWRTRSAGDFSYLMLSVLATGVFLWFVYGLLLGSLPIALANGVSCLLVLAIIVMKLFYERRK